MTVVTTVGQCAPWYDVCTRSGRCRRQRVPRGSRGRQDVYSASSRVRLVAYNCIAAAGISYMLCAAYAICRRISPARPRFVVCMGQDPKHASR